MTDEEHGEEQPVEEAIEDLEAPAAAQRAVAGGFDSIVDCCLQGTCNQTIARCDDLTKRRVIYEQ